MGPDQWRIVLQNEATGARRNINSFNRFTSRNRIYEPRGRGFESCQPRQQIQGPGEIQALFVVRPARAHSSGCKSRHELITASEAKRNCMRATECGEEAWSEAASRWTRTG